LRTLNKVAEQEDEDIRDLIAPSEEASSQAFVLSFRKYDPSRPLPSDGLWVPFATDAGDTCVVLRHAE
jgi:hypothetical protein